MEDMDKDYKENERLDRYDVESVDDEEYSDMDEEERRRVDKLLYERE